MRTGRIPEGGGDILAYGTDVGNLLNDTTLAGEWVARKALGADAIRLRHEAMRRQKESARLRRGN